MEIIIYEARNILGKLVQAMHHNQRTSRCNVKRLQINYHKFKVKISSQYNFHFSPLSLYLEVIFILFHSSCHMQMNEKIIILTKVKSY